MKTDTAVLICCLALAAPPAGSQTGSGSWELSLSGNFGSMSTSYEYSSGGTSRSGEGEGQGYLGLDFRAGYFITDGFSLEPEIYMLAVEGVPPAFNIGANAAYTFTLPESPVRPFVTAGFGTGNAIPIMQRLIDRSSGKLDIPVFRIGGGAKTFITKNIAVKVEYRYERYSHEDSYSGFGYSSTSKIVAHHHNVLVGFSVFLPAGG